MFKESAIRGLIIAGVCLLLAVLLGYMLASPQQSTSLMLFGLVFAVLAFPLFIRWHHALLIVSWNAALVVFFLPGQLQLGIALAAGSLFVSILTRMTGKQQTYLSYPPVSYPLYFLAIVVVVTMSVTGGLGGRVFGSESWGGKRYLDILGAIMGYFALVAQPVPSNRRLLLAGLFFLSGATAIFSDIIYAAGPGAYFLFAFFSQGIAASQALSQEDLVRFAGLTWMAQACCCFMLLRYGIRGICEWHRPWRLLLFAGMFVVSLFGGFRSAIVLFAILFAIQFYLEGLFRTLLFPALLVGGAVVIMFLAGFATRLPMAVQRSVSFLPIEVHPLARQDAVGSMEWRLEMWRLVLPDVPKYLWVGKGYEFNGTDLYLTQAAMRRGVFEAYEAAVVTGDYHSGPLTLIIPLGLAGVLGFGAFIWGSLRALHANYRYGDPALEKVNRFLLAYFWARLIYYMVFYGSFYLDLMVFTGVVGLSLTLNGGVRSKQETAAPAADRAGDKDAAFGKARRIFPLK